MTTVTQMKCACESCLCVVDTSKAVEKRVTTIAATPVRMGIPKVWAVGIRGVRAIANVG
jgi:hypothetical protein